MPASAPPPGPSDPPPSLIRGAGQGGPWSPQPVLGLHESLPIEKLTHLQNLLVILRGVEPSVSNNVFYQLLVVLCEPPGGREGRREGGEGSRPLGPLPHTSAPPAPLPVPATGSSASAPVCPVPALFSLRFGELENSNLILKTLLGQHQLLPLLSAWAHYGPDTPTPRLQAAASVAWAAWARARVAHVPS